MTEEDFKPAGSEPYKHIYDCIYRMQATGEKGAMCTKKDSVLLRYWEKILLYRTLDMNQHC
jgi:hypothetical protein